MAPWSGCWENEETFPCPFGSLDDGVRISLLQMDGIPCSTAITLAILPSSPAVTTFGFGSLWRLFWLDKSYI